ncbi:SDR family NAD(P)-dependent oxidoreductase [Clostridium manihotivorum]|uniref:Short-chain dehydrogenase n=1 Tax=Clostridium manihotivorum TaxID=2320868 RepID=A0A3R5QZC8_9CLOT|nr:SDR family oxidoreductase [Clostridium manihotivorum]QAA33107.1 short-chain dehydrogenase [Clostridium manihotivorum]
MVNNDTVLITGASSGIGYELAEVFASKKYDLVLVARSTEKLKEISDQLSKKYLIKVFIISEDLTKENAAETVFQKVKNNNIKVNILVNNAGAGKVGLFHQMDASEDYKMIQLNIASLTHLTKLFISEMMEQGSGKIMNVASTGAYSPGPFIATYYATKAYVLSLSEALYKELKPYNITVTTLCPGATKTNFTKNAGKKDAPGAMEAAKVARCGYEGLMKNKKLIVPGLINKILIRLPKNLVSTLNFKSQKNLAEK